MKPWDQRWFILTASSLRYYSSRETCDWGLPPKLLSIHGLRHYESLSDTDFQVSRQCHVHVLSDSSGTLVVAQLYFPGRILQLKAQHKEEANRWLACLHSLHIIALNSSFTKVSKGQTAAFVSQPSQKMQHQGAASILRLQPSRQPTAQLDDGVLFVKVDAQLFRPDSHDHLQQLSHLSVDQSSLSYTPLSDHAANSPFLTRREEQPRMLQPDNEASSCSRCRALSSTFATAAQECSTEEQVQASSLSEDNSDARFAHASKAWLTMTA